MFKEGGTKKRSGVIRGVTRQEGVSKQSVGETITGKRDAKEEEGKS